MVSTNPLYDQSSEFQLALSPEELKRILEEQTQTVSLDPKEEFTELTVPDQKVAQHLVRASAAINDVFLMQDHARNIEARTLLQNEALKGNEVAKKALIFFVMSNGIEALDYYAPQTTPMPLFKGMGRPDGGNLYPPDATKEEIAAHILAHPEDVASIISSNTKVIRDGKGFIGLPYSRAYQSEMRRAARELLLAAGHAQQDEFAHFLQLQAHALVNDCDPEYAYRADAAWVALPEDLPLEFAVIRENYDDHVTSALSDNPEVAAMFKANGVIVKKKDSFGARLGIVNPKAVSRLSRYREELARFNEEKMPLLDEYRYQLAGERKGNTLVDALLICMAGDAAVTTRGICAVAECLPNSDKLSVQLGSGCRVVFHHQVYQGKFSSGHSKRLLSATVDNSQRHLFRPETYLNFLVGHELGHSQGPLQTHSGQNKIAALGKYGSTIEEGSADMISVLLSDYMVGKRIISQKEHQETLMTWLVWNFPTKKASELEPHRLRSIMQLNYFKQRDAVQIERGKPFKMDETRLVHAAREMLTEISSMQLAGDAKVASDFVKRYAVWDEDMADLAKRTLSAEPKLYTRMLQSMSYRLLHAPVL